MLTRISIMMLWLSFIGSYEPGTVPYICYFIKSSLKTNFRWREHRYPHFTNEKTEARRELSICPKFQVAKGRARPPSQALVTPDPVSFTHHELLPPSPTSASLSPLSPHPSPPSFLGSRLPRTGLFVDLCRSTVQHHCPGTG